MIFKSVAGAKRWQPLARRAGAAGAPPEVEENYTVILGSHRNSCLKFEKNGETKDLVRGGRAGACGRRLHGRGMRARLPSHARGPPAVHGHA